jgi:hypothetical protein
MSYNTTNALIKELSSFRQFVVHRADKVPLRAADLLPASVINPADWCGYDEAFKRVGNDDVTGVGFCLSDLDNFTCIDLDTYKIDNDEKLSPEEKQQAKANHAEIFNSFASYSELSPSGGGVHVWCKGDVPTRKYSAHHVEVYSKAHYMTLTGKTIDNSNPAVEDRQDLLVQLLDSYDAATGQRKGNSPTLWTDQEEWFDDDTLIQKASNDAQGKRFQDLFAGRWRNYPEYPSQSEADLALCNHIAIYTNNMQQCGRIYWSSHLFLNSPKRKRKQRPDYLFHPEWGIVTKAFDQKLSLESFETIRKEYEQRTLTEVSSSDAIVEKPVSVFKRPTGLLGDIAEYIYRTSVQPNLEVSLAGAIVFLSGICGRQFNTSTGTGLNQFVVLLGETSQGKEGAARGISRLFKAVQPMAPAITQFAGPSDIASAPALLKFFADSPCFWSHKGEFGHWLQKLNNKYANSNETTLKGMLLELFHKSGHIDILMGSIYSDKKNNAPMVYSPALTLFGDSTPEEFYKAVDESNIAEGLISRLTVIPIPELKPHYNPDANKKSAVPDALKNDIAGLVKRVLDLQMTNEVIEVPETDEANAYQLAYQKLCMDRVWENKDKPSEKIWHRAHIRLLRTGTLIAVGNNPSDPCVTVDDYRWARVLVDYGVESVQKRFESGLVGKGNYHNEQVNDLKKFLMKYRDANWSDAVMKKYKVTFDMWKYRAIPFSVILNKCFGLASFKNSANPSLAIQSVMKEFEQAGFIAKCDASTVQGWNKRGNIWSVTMELE